MSAAELATTSLVDETEDHRALREAVSKLVGRYGRSYFQEVARDEGFPHELWRDLGESGFLGVHLEERWGGGGAGMSELAVVLETVAAHGCPVQMIVISPTICGSVIQRHGSEAIKKEWLPDLASGRRRMAFAITEPDAGTNTHKISTTIRRAEGGGWRLDGAKYWTSGVDEAQAVLVVARDAELSTPERPVLSMVVVPTDAPGFTMRPIDSALRAPERQFMTFYDAIELGEDAVVGERDQGLTQLFAGLNPERIAAAALANGIALYALARATEYARTRTVWSEPIGAHQGLAHPLAEAYVDVQLARMATTRAARLVDEDAPAGEASNIAKLTAADAVLRALDQAIQTHGGNGLSHEYGLADLWFTARMFKTAPVSREMVLNHVAQHSLGLPKSY